MPKHRHRMEEMGSSDEESVSTRDRRRHKKAGKKQKKKHHHKKKHRKRHRDEYSSSSSSSDGSYRRRRKKEKRQKKRKRKDNSDGKNKPHEEVKSTGKINERSHILAQALCNLFAARPLFAQELPILLIRLAGGSTFDLRNMEDQIASTSLERVLECLRVYGATKKNGEWSFEAPPGKQDERVLLRVIRAELNEVNVTMEAMMDYENAKTQSIAAKPIDLPIEDSAIDHLKTMTSSVVVKYQSKDSELGSQLALLCQNISQGESVSIDALPDEDLKAALEEIFVCCGLEKSEMVDEDFDDQENDGNDDPTMGYSLPEMEDNKIQLRLAAIMEACRNPTRRRLGPMRPTQKEKEITYNSDDEDEGPALPGEGRRPRGPTVPDHVLKAEANRRELELKATAAGVEIPLMSGGREEWMIVPGKHDFLSSIKSGQPMKSRGFQNKKTRGGDRPAAPIHPAIQAEMDAIFKAHEDARGPSLMDQHRATKAEEKKAAALSTNKGWTWNREKDLDAGRRVDKDALHMVLGGAADNLKTKFQGGFN